MRSNTAKPELLLFTSLYPYPWQPSRATFNYQQYRALEAHYAIRYLVPVPFQLWLRHLGKIWRQRHGAVCYFPLFYVPGLMRNLNGHFLMLSIVLCGVPLWRLLQARTVLASWAFPDGFACAMLKRFAGYRLFIQCLGSDVNVHQTVPARRRRLANAFRNADGVITVSEDLARKVRAIEPSAQVQTIYNGVNFEQFSLRKVPPPAKSLIFIGNLIRTKGIHELLTAIRQLDDPDVRLHVVGGGPELVALQKKTRQEGTEGQVYFHGVLPHREVAALLHQSQLLVLPSYTEGVPNVIMEALACGIPVVATAVGGIPEIVTSDNGILLEDHEPATITAGIRAGWQREWDPEAMQASISRHTWSANSETLKGLLQP